MPEQFQNQQLALATAQTPLALLSTLNERGRSAFAQASMPNRKTEAWKYTSLHTLLTGDFASQAKSADFDMNAIRTLVTIPNIDADRLVLVNGQLSIELSDEAALNRIVRFADANADQKDQIAQYLGQTLNDKSGHVFNQLNNAAISDGYFVLVNRNVQADTLLQISHITTQQQSAFTLNERLLVVLEQGASANIIEHFGSTNETQNSFTNTVTEIVIGDNARLTHYRLQLMQEDALHIGSTHIDLQRDANYNGFYLGLGTRLTRNDVVVNHNIGGSHCEMAGIYVPQNQQLIDFHTCIEHKAAHCTSNEVFRGIMNHKSKAVFNGRIHIHPDAQKTLAELSNKNLLLTNTAEIYTKPELEIYADDVKCAHGATVAQLDEKASFYLQSRGISAKDAEIMLSFGFINELLSATTHEGVGEWLYPILSERFGRSPELANALAGEHA
ncbi:Fe-S cluster assembly protein SufD [Thalassolituus oleivorans]|uniref:Fe-S cluster assembly protein SufD n=1 Tax=Thalassolituus oleivorans TaxID=187493 RepID=UPI0023F4B2D6|nr:Fe-S cluster assembly protein SufD [Thalassolituus oleivorans]